MTVQFRFINKAKHGWTQHLPKILLSLIVVLCTFACYQAYIAWKAHQLNQDYRSGAIVKHKLNANNHLLAYNIGYRLSQQKTTSLKKTSLLLAQTAKAFTLAEAASDASIRALAKFGLGNLYFDLALNSANIEAGGSHQQAVAHIELAREAYKGALRLNPDLYQARFNLELLDRLSPEKRTQAWLAETDGVTLQPFKRNGTAMMRDNKRRGLP
ncbi:MAG: hypothetical protein FJY53_03145 [Betaproteobacteria bacterium]|nr:hypothetical protein [Betaproteobacteria bacterium]